MFFKEKEIEKPVITSPPERVVTEEYSQPTELGQKVLILLESIESIKALTEVEELLNDLSSKKKIEVISSQQARDLMSPCRSKLKAVQGLLEAIYAILPPDKDGMYTGFSKPLNEIHTKRTVVPNLEN